MRSVMTEIVAKELYESYYPKPVFNPLANPEYITGVLGVPIPLNESFPYSSLLTEQILYEQLLFENFWGKVTQTAKDAAGKVKQKLIDAKDGIKIFGKEAWSIISVLYNAKQDPEAMKSLWGSIDKATIKPIKEKLRDILTAFVEGFDTMTTTDPPIPGMEALKKLTQQALDKLNEIFGKFYDMSGGWKKAFAAMSMAVGITFLWNKIGSALTKIRKLIGQKHFGQKEQVTSALKEKILPYLTTKFPSMMTKLASLSSGLKPYWDGLVKVAGGLKLVVQALGKGMDRWTSKFFRKDPEESTTEVGEKGEHIVKMSKSFHRKQASRSEQMGDKASAKWYQTIRGRRAESLVRNYIRAMLIQEQLEEGWKETAAKVALGATLAAAPSIASASDDYDTSSDDETTERAESESKVEAGKLKKNDDGNWEIAIELGPLKTLDMQMLKSLAGGKARTAFGKASSGKNLFSKDISVKIGFKTIDGTLTTAGAGNAHYVTATGVAL